MGQPHNMNGAFVEDSQVARAKTSKEESPLTASYRQGELIKLMVMLKMLPGVLSLCLYW